MKITFLGTGQAWGLPNDVCGCAICKTLKESDDPRDRRKRTSLYIEAADLKILVDCGIDFSQQRREHDIRTIDALLITHPHHDHIGGLYDLQAYEKGSLSWKPIPTYAHPDAWENIKKTKGFDFLVGEKNSCRVLEERNAYPGKSCLDARGVVITPFKTAHGSYAPGSVGYIIDGEGKRVIYTSDFSHVESREENIKEKPIDVLIMESEWFNEPKMRKFGHMSFQTAIGLFMEWKPKDVYLVHLSDADQIAGDPYNELPIKSPPLEPMKDLQGNPYPVPKTHKEWEVITKKVINELGLRCNIKIAYDDLKIILD